MKHLFSIVASLVISNISIVNSQNLDDIANRLKVPVEYVEMGDGHNESLDYALKKLEQDFAADSIAFCALTKNQIGNMAKEYIKDFFAQKGTPAMPVVMFSDYDIQWTDNDSAAIFTDKIHPLLKHKYQNVFQLMDSLAIVNEDARNSLSEKASQPVYLATSVAYYSWLYWLFRTKRWKRLMDAVNAPDNQLQRAQNKENTRTSNNKGKN